MSSFLNTHRAAPTTSRGNVSYEEKGTWVCLLASAGGYAAYLAIVLGRAGATPLVQVPYAAVLLWAVGGSVLRLVARRRGL